VLHSAPSLQPRGSGSGLLDLKGVAKAFGNLKAVDGVDLAVRPGRITGVIGPNGAGKTTLFNLVAGTLAPDAGEIVFAGERIDGLSPDRIFRRGLARTFQIPRPFPRMTVLENAMLAPIGQTGERFWANWWQAGRVAAEEKAARERAAEVLGFCGLGAQLGQLAGTLSGGQQKLLELARVLMVEPRLILLDEPAAGVNPALMEILVEKIRTLHARGIAFLVIEHNMDLVTRLCDPVVVMAAGRILVEGGPEEILAHPEVLDAYLGHAAA
jgi:branched-chain amino acid transport system ATP-binding protein